MFYSNVINVIFFLLKRPYIFYNGDRTTLVYIEVCITSKTNKTWISFQFPRHSRYSYNIDQANTFHSSIQSSKSTLGNDFLNFYVKLIKCCLFRAGLLYKLLRSKFNYCRWTMKVLWPPKNVRSLAILKLTHWKRSINCYLTILIIGNYI